MSMNKLTFILFMVVLCVLEMVTGTCTIMQDYDLHVVTRLLLLNKDLAHGLVFGDGRC